eukprot:TRINITY_DN14526_c0_g1_i1.p1 TRINITY_DN14526_c0_g1~~TRINITY_DN14526_c0_g1_i1.p1  ORF type:complete len:373 (+),score=31.01 TRINITY_DN14526_c0_g1_i1:157-1275(+)
MKFIRVTIEGVVSCNTDPRWDDSELLTGFPMYLDLTSVSALELLFKVLGLFVAMTDPLFDRADKIYASTVHRLMKDRDLFKEIEGQLEATCKEYVTMRGMAPHHHDNDFIQRSLEFDNSAESIAKDARKIPKTNWLAALRLVRRCTNKIAIQHSWFDFTYSTPHCYRMVSKWKEETEFLQERMHSWRNETMKLRMASPSSSHGYPQLWSSHFIRHLKNISPDIAKSLLDDLSLGRKLDETRLLDGFLIPALPELHRAQKLRFADQVSKMVASVSAGKPQGCPEPLLELLADSFQMWEEPHHFERFRTYRHQNLDYEPIPIDKKVLKMLFQGTCTKSLGTIIQPRNYCTSTNAILCHVCGFIRKNSGDCFRQD